MSRLVLGVCASSPPLATTSGADPVAAAHDEAGAGLTEGTSVPDPMNLER